MRFIDADWVLAHLKPYEPSDEEWCVTGGTALRLIHNAVDNAPTVDAVVVVRCKDCKYSRPLNKNEKERFVDGVLMCTNSEVSEYGITDVWDTHFCSYGEKR